MLTQIAAVDCHDGLRRFQVLYALDGGGRLWRLQDDEWRIVLPPSESERMDARNAERRREKEETDARNFL